jgi:hypothetical protein
MLRFMAMATQVAKEILTILSLVVVAMQARIR